MYQNRPHTRNMLQQGKKTGWQVRGDPHRLFKGVGSAVPDNGDRWSQYNI